MMFTVRNEVAKVIFLQVCVCPQGGGAWLGGSGPGGVPGPRGVCSQEVPAPGGRVWSGGCLVLGGSAPEGGVCSWGGGGIPAYTEADLPPGETASAADGTHPTGMHSCFKYFIAYLFMRYLFKIVN